MRAGDVSLLSDLLVCTHQSLNRCNQVRKACVLCDKVTSGDVESHTEAGLVCVSINLIMTTVDETTDHA